MSSKAAYFSHNPKKSFAYCLALCFSLGLGSAALADTKIADTAANFGSDATKRTPDGVLEVVGGSATKPIFVARPATNDTDSGQVSAASANTSLIIRNNGNVGIGTATPAGILDITSTTSGFLPPRMTTAQRTAIASPVAGFTVYDTNTNSLWFHNGTAWNNADYARTLVDVSASRSFNTTFTNTNAYPITVMYTVTSNNGAATSQTITVNGFAAGVCNSFSGVPGSMTFVVPAGGTYRIAFHGGVDIFKWLELR